MLTAPTLAQIESIVHGRIRALLAERVGEFVRRVPAAVEPSREHVAILVDLDAREDVARSAGIVIHLHRRADNRRVRCQRLDQ